jgi:septal ring factor EnvC (AmiA/AmiB activator)
MKKIILFLAILISAIAINAQPVQDKAQMEKERQELQDEIKAIERDYIRVHGQAKSSLGELNVLNKKINLQERFINSISKELRFIDDDLYRSNIEIYRLQNQLDTLKMQYAKSVVYAYKNRSNYDYLNFIFSATSFNDAMKRISYLKQYRKYREQQAETIKETQELILQRRKQQLSKKETKNVALKNQTSQVTELAKQKNEKAAVVSKLKGQEKDLLAQLNAKKKRDKDIKNAIAAVIKRIAKENDIARKKAEAAEAEANKRNATTVTPAIGDKPGATVIKPTTVKTNNNSIELNSGDIKLSGEFQTNKGKLPWPVDNGYVSIHFGKYNVEELKGIVGESSGITIMTENSGQTVKSVFDGEVVAVHDLGDSKAVFVKHGKFLTSYGNLSSVSVSKGSRVSTGQQLGKTATADNGTGGQIDFMLLIEAREQNPEQWLRRR